MNVEPFEGWYRAILTGPYTSRMWFLLLLCVISTSGVAQQYSHRDDPESLLLGVRKKVMLKVNQLPKYLCTETIDRSTFHPIPNVIGHSCDDLALLREKADWRVHKDTSDRLRLDVAVSRQNEIYSWAGEDRFEDRSLADLVQSGTTATGAFASFLMEIFGTNAANFTYDGDIDADGRALAAFGFSVPAEKSRYRFGNKLHNAIVGYDGTFLVDPATSDLKRLTVRSVRLPEEFNACEDTTVFAYGKVRLNNTDFLLPQNVILRVIFVDGSEVENRTVFSSCREFHGESSLSFDTLPTEQEVAQQKASKVVGLPPGLPFRLALTHAIDTATAAAGDLVRAELTSPIKEKHTGVLISKGTPVTGRIVQLKRFYGPVSDSLTLAIKLETVEVNGRPQRFDARLESVLKKPINSNLSSVVRQSLGSFDQIFRSEDPAVGVFRFQDVTRDYIIDRGLEIVGVTATSR
jgi:hypothetical protein